MRRAVTVGIAAALTVGGVAWAAVLWWPTGGLPERWLDRGDQIASIISMLLTAAGVALAYLALRRRPASTRGQEEEPLPQARTGGLSVPVWVPADIRTTGPEGGLVSPPPQQLPLDATWFTGRGAELEQLLALAPDQDPQRVSAVVISAIDGMAGIGKTALAVHVAHRIAGRYPDGQLFIDLHGFTQTMTPVEPGDALDRMLRGLGMPGERIPADVDDRAGLWRSTLAGRRMLIVLDNAATEAQVAPLLPGAPGCLVLVTSRRSLIGLAATHSLSLDTLPLADAITLFTRTVGEQRLAGESPELVVETVELCGRLPLAIWIAAARLRPHRTWRLVDLVERLRSQQQRLAELEAGQRSVTAALEVSYQQLSAGQQRAYRLLGLHPGPDIDTNVAAALADTSPEQARRLLDDLLEVHMVQEPVPGRYVFHDLVRTHAANSVNRDEPEPARDVALTRLLDHFRHTASVAMDVTHPFERERRPSVPAAATPTPDLSNPARADTWLNAELPNLLAAARYAADHGRPEHTWHLSGILRGHLRTRGRYRDAEPLHCQALTTARTAGNHDGELDALLGLGDAHRRQGRYEQAIDHFSQACRLAEVTGHRAGELDALNGLGWISQRQGRNEQAFAQYQQALEIARTTAHPAGELDALTGLGYVHLVQGRYENALAQYEQALEIARTTAHLAGELDVLHNLGNVHRRQGRYRQAANHYRQALEIARTTDNRAGELHALHGLGNVHRRQGRYRQAANHYGQALEIARTTGNRVGELFALTGLAWIDRLEGRHQPAADQYQQVLDLAREVGDRNLQLEAIHGLGRLHHATGRPGAALINHQQALELATDLGQPAEQTRAHDGVAHAHHALNQPEQARQHWRHALEILTSLGTDHTEDEEAGVPTIRAHLADLDEQQEPPAMPG